ncbi:MAG: peptidase T [Fibrobacter sp.]|nr:peptidase T [Fibrobacter sp.]
MKEKILNRFLRYVKIDTQSDKHSTSVPSTHNQFDLANTLVDELQSLGISDAYVNEHCYVFATLRSNCMTNEPVIALFAHLDTSPDVSGAKVNPQVISHYNGEDIILPNNPSVIIAVSENPHLKESIGHTIVTTDGTTLLGSDDKAGITAIMSCIEYLIANPGIKHGDIRICFTPDEETGNGITHFSLDELRADFGYTVDGGFIGELNKETFSADSATIEFKGVDMHPGYAKDKMINSMKALAFFLEQLPDHLAPEHTSGYEPYIHPASIHGSVALSGIDLLLRDFSDDGLQRLRTFIDTIIKRTQQKFPETSITVSYKESYRNMAQALTLFPHSTERVEKATIKAGLSPYWVPIRGGTDGSKLTALGLPTPNIFTAACNAHSLTEWQSIDGLVSVVDTLVNLVSCQPE